MSLWRETGNRAGLGGTLHVLGSVLYDQGNLASAAALLEESRFLFKAIGIKAWCTFSLCSLARDRGDLDRAMALYREDLALRQELGDRRGLAECLMKIAGGCLVQGDLARAARLFGAAEALRAAIGVPLPPRSRTRYEQDVAAMRAGLGQDTFAAAWEEGRAMTLEEACAFGMRTAVPSDPAQDA